MGTATSSIAYAGIAAAVLAGAAGCGSAGQTSGGAAHAGGAFAGVSATAPPAAWRALRIASGAVLFYPPGWTPVTGDRGTATVTLSGANGHLLGYLNLTPRQGDETLANWAHFRVEHNAREGDRAVTSEASASGIHFRTGTGSCVRDRYATSTGARYIELACLVKGAAASSVIVAASPPQAWGRVSPVLYRALSSLRT
jgi:hypothetical protein